MPEGRIRIKRLPLVPNVCNQLLREVYRNDQASLAHVIMPRGEVSLTHWHRKFIEWYYILRGRGLMEVGKKAFPVRGGDVIIIPPREKHRLFNKGAGVLEHLVFSTPPFNSQDVITAEENDDPE